MVVCSEPPPRTNAEGSPLHADDLGRANAHAQALQGVSRAAASSAFGKSSTTARRRSPTSAPATTFTQVVSVYDGDEQFVGHVVSPARAGAAPYGGRRSRMWHSHWSLKSGARWCDLPDA